MLNKPKGYVVTKSDPLNRKTIFSLVPKELGSKLWNVGRLDSDTEGLMILTNDGDLTQELSHPKNEHEKEYEAIVQETPSQHQLERLMDGVEIDSGTTYPAEATANGNTVSITIHEGKNRQIRKMFEKVGLTILNLRRIRINKLVMPRNLPVGQFKEIKKQNII